MKKLTDIEYWNSNYRSRGPITPVRLEGFRNLCNARIFDVKSRNACGFNSVLEIGGGGSAWIGFLALNYPRATIATVDFSTDGAELLDEFALRNSLQNLKIFREDFIEPSSDIGTFDFVYSHGVVEHFEDLAATMKAKARFLTPNGRMFTLIPNMAGVLGPLTKWMDNSIYDIHVPHDIDSFIAGHTEAGLRVVEAGYLCSVNFGVLSSCIRENQGFKHFVYMTLSRLTTIVWLFETKVVRLPATRLLSPYIYVVSELQSNV